MASLPTVAIAGATGNLGAKIADAFLLPQFRARFRDVVVLARAASPRTERLVSLGAQLRVYSEDDVAASLQGVDVLINACVLHILTAWWLPWWHRTDSG